jgi:CubicO group peptidase (beta-lactamase class C family)
MSAVEGRWEPEYAAVIAAFAEILADAPGGGAALAVWVGGRPVIDAWGGLARPRDAVPWTRDTLAVTFSCTKGLLATCALRAAEREGLDLDGPVAAYWPELRAAAAPGLTARAVLAHRAGLPALDVDLTLQQVQDGNSALAALEAQEPLWEPGTAHAYHAMTYGWLVAELLCRATGRSLREHFDELTVGPDNDTWLGLRPGHRDRLAEASWDPAGSDLQFPPDRPDTPWQQRTITRAITLGGAFAPELIGPGTGFNDPEMLRHPIPAIGVVSSAQSLARIWAYTIGAVDGRPALLGPHAVTEAARPLSEGETALATPPPHARWATGHMVRSPVAPMLTDRSFGHDGAGGQLGFADPIHDVGFAFLTNVLRNRGDNRSARLVAALRGALNG